MDTKNMTVYLNTFERSKVLEIFMKIVTKKSPDLVICNEINKTDEKIILCYHPYLHRLDLRSFDTVFLFCNPDCTGLISSPNHFLKAINPSDEFFKIMES